jgi:mannitol-1-phosphate 5-dehydrogenase
MMVLTGTRTYVGFGFGAIQAGLFLYEAYHSGAFQHLRVAEVVPEAVSAVRESRGYYHLNVAHSERIERAVIGPVAIENPGQEADRTRLIQSISEAEEIGTAVPSVECYVSEGPGSLHRVLAQGLRRKITINGPHAVIYAAENHNEAAHILRSKVLSEIPHQERDAVDRRVQFLDTVIGKMSGIVTDPEHIQQQQLQPITPQGQRAFLVEAFNRILISRVRLQERLAEGDFTRGISVFEEKDDLLPFEEAKLYGHNAIHALAAYLGAVKDLRTIADLKQLPGGMEFLRAACLEESGEALIRKHGGFDYLFSKEGFREYADDLLGRMMSPYLGDSVERVGRDVSRKLGWDDRLVGTIRLCLQEGLEPRRFAAGVAAALAVLEPSILSKDTFSLQLLHDIWQDASPDRRDSERVSELVLGGAEQLRRWLDSGSGNLESWFS